jgi:hypothetical protein
MNALRWLQDNDEPFTFSAPVRLVARCEDCEERAQDGCDRYNRQFVYEFVVKHEGHRVSVGKVLGGIDERR